MHTHTIIRGHTLGQPVTPSTENWAPSQESSFFLCVFLTCLFFVFASSSLMLFFKRLFFLLPLSPCYLSACSPHFFVATHLAWHVQYFFFPSPLPPSVSLSLHWFLLLSFSSTAPAQWHFTLTLSICVCVCVLCVFALPFCNAVRLWLRVPSDTTRTIRHAGSERCMFL